WRTVPIWRSVVATSRAAGLATGRCDADSSHGSATVWRGACSASRRPPPPPAHDATAGFRAWRAELLVAIEVGSVASDGYAFLVETLWRAARVGGRRVARPTLFVV